MEVQFGPNPVDEPNLLFKLQRKIKVFNTNNPLPNRGYNLVASSSKYGIVFIGAPDGTLSAYHLKELIDKECDPKHLAINLPEKPTHISVSCDQELLASTGGQLLCVYKVADFKNVNVTPAVSINLEASPSTFVSALQWNPCIPDNIAIALYDGTLIVSSVSTGQIKKVQAKARCICWSPKGKQLVTGNNDGSLCQYKPDLTLAKTMPAPNLFDGAPAEALAIYWISTFQFAVVYKNATDNNRPTVTVVNTPKGGQPSCLNYEDVCYSMGNSRPWYYYLQGLPQWNIVLASSSNSMEIATLGSTDGANWTQWCQSDEARPELPLTDKKIENYPVGLCIDVCGIHQLPWGENETLPHMPLLHVVSQSGLLTIFNIIHLNKAAPQVCTPPQQLTLLALPQNALTSDIPDDAPAQVTLPPPKPAAEPKPQPPPEPVAAQPAAVQSTPAFATQPPSFFAAKTFQQPTPQTVAAPVAQAEPVKQPEAKPTPVAAATQSPVTQPKTQSSQTPTVGKQPQQTPEMSAALKEQERVNKLKAEQELKNMLVKEVNEFQTELHKFVVKTREMQNKLQQELNSIDANIDFQWDAEKLKKDCDLEELHNNVVQLKLELIRACAAVAEARTHADSKEYHQWVQVDPLTIKRVATIKNLSYYVQTQLEQVQKALDHRWSDVLSNDSHSRKPGQRMIRPILDDVYQPLVKQQEILTRQQAVLRTLKNALKEIEPAPMFKSTSLLRSTPFKTKDPLSKLTKNILNMSIEPQNNKPKEVFTAQKYDALRDLLSNHKPPKIKPLNIELQQHLAQMKSSYEKSLKEKEMQKQERIKPEPLPQSSQPAKVESQPLQPAIQPTLQAAAPATTVKASPDVVTKVPTAQINIPSLTPLNQTSKPGLTNVARTLFTDDEIQSQQKFPQTDGKPPIISFGSGVPTSTTASANTRSMLKDMLMNKQVNLEAKNDANTFMGQKICSPTAFSFATTSAQSASPFTSKPISDMSNMFSKFSPQSFGTEPKPQTQMLPPKSTPAETVEPAKPIVKPFELKKEEKSAISIQIKAPAPLAASTPVPDVLKTNKSEKPTLKPVKLAEKKENIPDKGSENSAPIAIKLSDPEKKDTPKAFSFGTSKSSNMMFGLPTTVSLPTSEASKQAEIKTESKPENKENKPDTPTQVVTTSASSLFAAANSGSPAVATKIEPTGFGATASPTSAPPVVSSASTKTSEPPTPTTEAPSTVETAPLSPASSASSIFASAAASQPIASTQSSSLFSAASGANGITATQGSVFGTATTQSSSGFSTPSIFGSGNKPTIFSTPTPASPGAFGSPASTAAATTVPSAFSSTTTSVFGSTAVTSAPAFGSSSVFSAPSTTSASVFGATPNQTASVFGTAPTATTQSIFGATTTPSVFGSASPASIFEKAAGTTQASVFGTPATTSQSVFGTSTATTQASIFGSPSTTTSIFGATTTTQQSVFGASSATVFGSGTATGSVFGSAAPTQSVFGAPTTTQASVFGSPTATTQASVFGSPTATTQASVFGTPTATTQASVFGTPSATTQASVFGTPTATTQASVFGTPPATTASGGLFGGTENLFAAASISTTNAGSPLSGGSIFGGGASTGSVFGSSSSANVFGSKTSFSQSNPQAAAIFGGASQSAFGQKPASNFWSGGGATGGTGFGTSGFGQQATTQASSIFGGSTGGSFSAPSGGAFGSPQQQTSVFGSPQQQSVFGGSPVFGAKPAFGQPAAFGSPTSGGAFSGAKAGTGFGAPAAFGGAPAFGAPAFGGSSPGKVFGGASPTPSFGTTQSNATFEQLATQNTLTFGNLAQQSPQQPQPAPSFNTSPSFTGWRG